MPGWRPRAPLQPWHDLLDRFQRIAQGADRLQPALNIEKALLPHDPLAPSAHDRVRSPSQIRGDLARGIFRGALKSFIRSIRSSLNRRFGGLLSTGFTRATSICGKVPVGRIVADS